MSAYAAAAAARRVATKAACAAAALSAAMRCPSLAAAPLPAAAALPLAMPALVGCKPGMLAMPWWYAGAPDGGGANPGICSAMAACGGAEEPAAMPSD